MITREIGLAILQATPLRGPGRTVEEIHRLVRPEHPGVTQETVEKFLDALVTSRAAWFDGPATNRRYARHH